MVAADVRSVTTGLGITGSGWVLQSFLGSPELTAQREWLAAVVILGVQAVVVSVGLFFVPRLDALAVRRRDRRFHIDERHVT